MSQTLFDLLEQTVKNVTLALPEAKSALIDITITVSAADYARIAKSDPDHVEEEGYVEVRVFKLPEGLVRDQNMTQKLVDESKITHSHSIAVMPDGETE